jgi:hypothetical protein
MARASNPCRVRARREEHPVAFVARSAGAAPGAPVVSVFGTLFPVQSSRESGPGAMASRRASDSFLRSEHPSKNLVVPGYALVL